MLAAESYKLRLEKGLNFVEFNYMLLQAYDFLHLFKYHDCVMQMGGNDQWGNMLAGIDLIRRVEGRMAHSMTFPLLTTSQGHKMGKTEKGTVWLDQALTLPYDYYQYWVNVDDADVERFLALFTFLPMEEIKQVRTLVDVELNIAKSVLAFEATKITHGEAAAVSAWQASAAAFRTRPVAQGLFSSSTIPRSPMEEDISAIVTLEKSQDELEQGLKIVSTCCAAGLTDSTSEARRLIAQGGIYVNDRQVKTIDERMSLEDLNDRGEIRLRKGKKKYAIIRRKNT
jgi:tyrosyl-tRNA synthetase